MTIELTQRGSFSADQAELLAFKDGVTSVSMCTLDERISGEAYDIGDSETDESPFQTPIWQKELLGEAKLSGEALEVIAERQRLLGELYPFEVSGSGLTYRNRQAKPGLYEFCLATCAAVMYPEKGFQRLIRHFERVATKLLIAFCGAGSFGYRCGWPSESDFESTTQGIHARISLMKSKCFFGEDEWVINNASLMQHQISKAKDARIDLVIRRPLLDGRPGALTIVGQCGCGKHDVDDDSRKHKELDMGWLRTFFDRITTPQPLFAFATSQHVASLTQLYMKQNEAKVLFFDRIRLVLLAHSHPECLTCEEKFMGTMTQKIRTMNRA